MPEVNKHRFLQPIGITAWINGASGSSKTRLGMGFPDVMAITFDPTGLDCLKEPENVKLLDNLRWHVPLNGIPLNQVFQFSEEPGETGIYCVLCPSDLSLYSKTYCDLHREVRYGN